MMPEDGRLEQINVNKDIDALLLKNTQKILKVRSILLRKKWILFLR